MANVYSLFKGRLVQAAPYKDKYSGSPHYIVTLTSDENDRFNVVVNSASQVPAGPNHDTRVLSYIDQHFDDAITAKLVALKPGLYASGNFPKLDYWQDKSLLDISRFRVVPYKDEDGRRFDINDQIDALLTIDETQPSFAYPFNNGTTTKDRDFWNPTNQNIIVYGFGFVFPAHDGLHETHMNQGNPRNGGHANENGAFQDGALIIQIGQQFSAVFTAFQSQMLPTLANGYPAPNAKPIDSFLSA